MRKFEHHGDFRLTVDGRIFISTVRGPFNVEFTGVYIRAAAPVAHALGATGPWACVAEYTESALFSLESAAIMRKQTIIAATQLQLAANCWVVPPTVEGYGVIDRQARRMYEDILPFAIFEHSADARAWLQEQLALKLQPAQEG